MREIKSCYVDPLEIIWVRCVLNLGWSVHRSGDVFASWDGVNRLTIGRDADLDGDDHFGQMVLHEICHALIEAPEGLTMTDWGLDNQDARHLDRELACHRLQAFWADQVNLRVFFAVTTDWRLYYDLIPPQALLPLSEGLLEQWCHKWTLTISEARALDQRALGLAQQGIEQATSLHWKTHIYRALCDTQKIADILKDYACEGHLYSLWFKDVFRNEKS